MSKAGTATRRRRGRPVRGVVTGFFFGLVVALDLVLLGVTPTNATGLVLLPPLGVALGLLLGLTAPFRRRRRSGQVAPDSDLEGVVA